MNKISDKQIGLLQANGLLPDPYICYTDGACDNNGSKIGGAAYFIYDPEGVEYKKGSGSALNTTNNRCEMMGIICAIGNLPQGAAAIVRTDSQYAIGAFTNGGSANQDLISKFHKYEKRLAYVKFEKIKGHSGEPSNELVDKMANEAYKQKCVEMGQKVNSWVINGFPKRK